MSALSIRVPFHSGSIPCILESHGATPYVMLEPVCEDLGVDFETHHKRLRQQPWAVVEHKAIADQGENVVVIDRLTFAMWLATLQTSRMRQAAARAKVELYQREAARAVEHHFFGAPNGSAVGHGSQFLLPAKELIGELIERQVHVERRLAELESTQRPVE